MNRGRKWIAWLCLVPTWFCGFSGAAEAECVYCDSQANCMVQFPGYSGNCECEMRVRRGYEICIPRGVCDPNDPNTCGGGGPRPTAAPVRSAVDLRLDRLSESAPLLSAALSALSIGFSKSAPATPVLEQSTVEGVVFDGHDGYRFTLEAEVSGPIVSGRCDFTGTGSAPLYEWEFDTATGRGKGTEVGGGKSLAPFAW